MTKIIVLVTQGKHASVDYAKAVLFDTVPETLSYADEMTTQRVKHWVHAEVVGNKERVELCSPEY